MKYNYREGVERQKSRKWVIAPILIVLLSAYAVVDYLSPEILYVVAPTDTTAKKLVSSQPTQDENQLYIPKINADITIVTSGGDEFAIPEKGALQRATTSGNPTEGGNYVLVANRFSLGLTPTDTQSKSPFYHIGKLSGGDDIYVDYGGTRYAYKVEQQKSVSETSEVEARTDKPQLTLYTNDAALHHVIIAKQVGKIVWTSGQPKLQPLED